MGLSQKETAYRMGVDQGTPARWERGEREPTGALAERVPRFVKAPEVTSSPVAALTA
jgi:transcriptional regulator with XRE-family HTH domain